ncbi:MAG: hypothetical protein ABII64_02860 [Elusimicrobiota bacterium]
MKYCDLLNKLDSWILKPLGRDIKYYKSRNQFISFIILSIVIDNLASIRYKEEIPDKIRGAVGMRYKKFIENYMPREYKIHKDHLYVDFRCKIIHVFQLKYFDLQQSKLSEKYHLEIMPSGDICLNSKCFYKDVYKAYGKLRRDLTGKTAAPEYGPLSHTEIRKEGNNIILPEKRNIKY